DGSGTSATDSSGNGRNAVLSTTATTPNCTGTPTWTTGRFGGGLSFNGTSNCVSINDAAFNLYPITITAWIKTPGSNTYGGIVSKSATAASNGYLFYVNAANGILYGQYFNAASVWASYSSSFVVKDN